MKLYFDLQKSRKLAIASLFLLLTACNNSTTTETAQSKPPVVDKILGQEICASDIAESDHKDNPIFTPLNLQPVKDLDPLLANVRSRQFFSLNGKWNYIVDQLGVGDASPLLRGGVGENQSYGPNELLEYAFDSSYQLEVPGDWNTQQESLFWYRGIVWYQRSFEYALPAGQRAFLYFGGANFAKDVYLNGKMVARHKGGFTPFNTEVTNYLVQGSNDIVVKVNSFSGPAEIPTEHNDWMNYGGLTRDVMLVQTTADFIENYKVQLKPGDKNTIQGWVKVNAQSPASNKKLAPRLSIPAADIELDLELDDTGFVRFEVPAQLNLWSPEEPTLYDVQWHLRDSTISDQIGFRTIETKGENILLNGESIFLRGISMHEESLLKMGRAASAEEADAVIAKLGELNANFIRLAHYPHNEHMVRAADRAGVLVWAEMPVYHNIQFENPCTLQSAKQQYAELIARDQNRASVIMWSLGNETPESEARNRFFKSMAEFVRAQDNTRLLTAALLGFGGMEAIGKYLGTLLAAKQSKLVDLFTDPEPVIINIQDPLGELVDIIGYNEYLGWYLSGILAQKMNENGLQVSEAEVRELMLQEMEAISIVTDFNKPLVISEFGAGAKKGTRGDGLTIWSEDYQARVYQQQLKMLQNSPSLRGLSPWILKDFRAPYRLNTKVQDYWNRKGLLSETGEKKLAFDILAEYYLKKSTEKAPIEPLSTN